MNIEWFLLIKIFCLVAITIGIIHSVKITNMADMWSILHITEWLTGIKLAWIIIAAGSIREAIDNIEKFHFDLNKSSNVIGKMIVSICLKIKSLIGHSHTIGLL